LILTFTILQTYKSIAEMRTKTNLHKCSCTPSKFDYCTFETLSGIRIWICCIRNICISGAESRSERNRIVEPDQI
jgi:hypothetical protein